MKKIKEVKECPIHGCRLGEKDHCEECCMDWYNVDERKRVLVRIARDLKLVNVICHNAKYADEMDIEKIPLLMITYEGLKKMKKLPVLNHPSKREDLLESQASQQQPAPGEAEPRLRGFPKFPRNKLISEAEIFKSL